MVRQVKWLGKEEEHCSVVNWLLPCGKPVKNAHFCPCNYEGVYDVGQPSTKKWVFFAGSVWTLARTQGEVRGDKEPPGDTWRHPILPKKYLYKTWYGQQLLLVKKFCATHPTRGSLSKNGTDQYYSP